MGAMVTPMRGTEEIMWTVKFRNGKIKRFKFPIRTNPEGSAVPDGGFATGTEDLSSPVLYTEPESSGMSELAKL